jgi:hypothetical protein
VGVALAGCQSTGQGPSSGSGDSSSLAVASDGGPPATAEAGTCYPWSGLEALSGVGLPLRMMASDEEIYGAGSTQVNSDGLGVEAAIDPVVNSFTELPSPYAEDVQNEVISVAVSPYSATPDQLNAAAANADNLSSTISQLCLSSPS